MSESQAHEVRAVRLWTERRTVTNVYGEEFGKQVGFAELTDGTIVGSVSPCQPPYYATPRPGWYMGVTGRDIVTFRGPEGR